MSDIEKPVANSIQKDLIAAYSMGAKAAIKSIMQLLKKNPNLPSEHYRIALEEWLKADIEKMVKDANNFRN